MRETLTTYILYNVTCIWSSSDADRSSFFDSFTSIKKSQYFTAFNYACNGYKRDFFFFAGTYAIWETYLMLIILDILFLDGYSILYIIKQQKLGIEYAKKSVVN